MTLPIDPATLAPQAQKILDPKTPPPLKQMAARGIAPGLKPRDALAVVVLLAQGADAQAATIAQGTLEKLPAPLLNGALTPDLPAGVIDVIAPRYASDVDVMQRILALPQIAASTVAEVAARASEAVSELVATNEERLLKYPEIIEKLYMNKATRMSTADRILELAVRNRIELTGIPAYKEAAAAIQMELVAEPTPEPTPDDVMFKEAERVSGEIDQNFDPANEDTHALDPETGEEKVEEKIRPLHERYSELTLTAKIRGALLEGPSFRLLALRDPNKLVAQAAARSPTMQESEVVRITASRAVCDDVLRIIAMDKRWVRTHQVKINLVTNPRTPFAFAAKLLPHLREHELKALAKSKNVTGAVSTAAKQQLERRNQKF